MPNRQTELGSLYRDDAAAAVRKVRDALRSAGGVVTAAARDLDLSPDQLRRYIERMHLQGYLKKLRDGDLAGPSA